MESYDEDVVMELSSNSVEEVERNAAAIEQRIRSMMQ
jgi:hypothetical protein